MKRVIANFKKYKYLLKELVKKDIMLKYRSSVLGLLWTLLEPLLTMLVLTFVFGSFLGRGTKDFPVYVLAGRLIYSLFSNGTKLGLKSIRRNSSMIKKVYVPKYIYPLSSALSSFITFLFSLIVLVPVAIFCEVKPTWHLIEAILPMIVILVMTMGVSLILATMDVFFRDTEYLWGVILMLVMYASAIFYTTEKIFESPVKAFVIKANPLFCVITNFREAIYGVPMNYKYFAYSASVSVVCLLFGMFLFYKKQDKFVLYI